jgi:CelD/BcsL family acetyltransferase involved in cellulose biosynthesis
VGVTERAASAIRQRWPSDSFEGHYSEAPYVPLDRLRREDTPYLSTLSANTRAQIRRSIRLYKETLGEPTVSVAESGEETGEWFSEMMSLHRERWQTKGLPGAFEGEAVRRFHALLHERCRGQERGDELAVDIVRIRFGDHTIGFLYNLAYRGRVSFYQGGLHYNEDNRRKPGLVTHTLAIDHYLQRGWNEYDFLGGEPGSVRYKRSLSTAARTLAWIQLPAPSLKMRVLQGLRHGRRRIKSAMGRSQTSS